MTRPTPEVIRAAWLVRTWYAWYRPEVDVSDEVRKEWDLYSASLASSAARIYWGRTPPMRGKSSKARS